MTPARLRNVFLIIFGLWALVLLVLWLLPAPAKPPPIGTVPDIPKTETSQVIEITSPTETTAATSTTDVALPATIANATSTDSPQQSPTALNESPTAQATLTPTAGPSPTITPQYDATLAARLVELRGEWAGMATVKVNKQPRIKLRQVILKFEQHCVMGQVCARLQDDSGKASALVLYRIRGRTVSLRSIDLAFSERCKNPMVFTLAPRRDGGQTLAGSCTDLDGLAVSWSATLYAR